MKWNSYRDFWTDMKINILTIFPDMFAPLRMSMLGRAIDNGIIELNITDIRDYTTDRHNRVDDTPYGGGAGMIMRAGPLLDALADVQTADSHTVVLAPAGCLYTQKKAREYAEKEHLILIAGHYEGIDARVYEKAEELVSVGDYIVTGGELPSMLIADSVVRLLDGVLRRESTEDESFENGLLEYPQYTKPQEIHGMKVPDVLLSGDHGAIKEWRRTQSLRLTRENRPDLYEKFMQSEKKNLTSEGQE